MSVLKFVNWIERVGSYCVDDVNPIQHKEISLPSAMSLVCAGVLMVICMAWWMVPLQYAVKKLNLESIKFK